MRLAVLLAVRGAVLPFALQLAVRFAEQIAMRFAVRLWFKVLGAVGRADFDAVSCAVSCRVCLAFCGFLVTVRFAATREVCYYPCGSLVSVRFAVRFAVPFSVWHALWVVFLVFCSTKPKLSFVKLSFCYPVPSPTGRDPRHALERGR